MYKAFVCCSLLATAFVAVTAIGDNMLGPGRWFVLSINLCDNHDQFEFQFQIQRQRLTRDQDCYNANMTLEKPIDESLGVRIEMCVHVDGGCKPYQVLSDESFIGFVEKYAKNNIEQALTLANVDPPQLPLEPGVYIIAKYVFNYCELPTDAVYGKFGAIAYLIQDNKDVGCVSFTVEFREVDGACEGDDEEYSER